MPRIIALEHFKFIERFQSEGNSTFINQVSVQTVVTNDGYIVPANLVVRMHYSQRHSHVFFVTMNPLEKMTPFKNGLQYPAN